MICSSDVFWYDGTTCCSSTRSPLGGAHVTESIIRITDPSMLQEAFYIRRQVFVAEQQIPEDMELDQHDHSPNTIHMLARDSSGIAVGAARLRPYYGDAVGDETREAGSDGGSVGDRVAKVERVAVALSHRGTGLGRLLMENIEGQAVRAGFRDIRLNAQIGARGFYERLGYEPIGSTFYEAGIEHIAMGKRLS
jgi:predicted GNAT family N-acyltransferase